jgi:mRNA-degrading endonuclease toxin of MazEF toxin-antitoxin module
MVRGEVFRLPAPRRVRGHEQRDARDAVIVQDEEFLDLSTTLVAPTSTSARPASFRPPSRSTIARPASSSSRRRSECPQPSSVVSIGIARIVTRRP